MKKNRGKFIVIDGTDGSGKTTQLNLLKIRLEKKGYKVKTADFPQYNTKSAGAIEEYLSGKYGTVDEVGPYKAAIFYATDRYDASFKIRKWLTEGYIVLANRYTSANMGHQGGKIAKPLERQVFFNWLDNLEYKILEIPRPDLSIILHIESNIAQKLAQNRQREDWVGKINDIHENNLHHLQRAEQVYLEIVNNFPNFYLINCSQNKKILNREKISSAVWKIVKKIINYQASKSPNLPTISQLINSHQQIINNQKIILKPIKKTLSKNPKTRIKVKSLKIKKIK